MSDAGWLPIAFLTGCAPLTAQSESLFASDVLVRLDIVRRSFVHLI
jgi:hypothetical protein